DAAGNESLDGPSTTFRIDVVAPTWPADASLMAAVTGNAATLTWTAAADNVAVAGYRLFQDAQVVAETDPGTLSAQVASLSPNIVHSFQVQAFDRASNVSTDGPTVTVRIDTLPPSWPNGAVLTATRIDPSTVALAWSTANDDVLVAGYRLFQNGQPSTDVGAGTHTFTVAALDPSAAYTFQVQAFDAAGNVSTDGPRVDVGASV